jgi:hypothetical protein
MAIDFSGLSGDLLGHLGTSDAGLSQGILNGATTQFLGVVTPQGTDGPSPMVAGVDQFNVLFDNDINVNLAVVLQVGDGNAADLAQNIWNGNNGQLIAGHEASPDGFGFSGLGQLNGLFDHDTNVNLGVVTQVGDWWLPS